MELFRIEYLDKNGAVIRWYAVKIPWPVLIGFAMGLFFSAFIVRAL